MKQLTAAGTLRRALSLLAVTLTVLVGTAVTQLATAAPASASIWRVPAPHTALDPLLHLTEFENRVVFRINQHRRAAGLAPVRWFGSCIDGYAERWAGHLAATGAFQHRDQTKILNGCDLTWVGETLVRGTAITPGDVVNAWLHSPEHRAVIMKPRANRAGVGVRLDGQGRIVGVLNFGDTD